MTDNELLKLAAKVAGLEIDEEATAETGRGVYLDDNNMTLWNPLTDDGDAFRLAVKLGLGLDVLLTLGATEVSTDDELKTILEYHNDDPYTATRRAIVRAAAEMVETLRKQAGKK
jgi:hypothetical protein